MRYIGNLCSGCNKPFTDTDDIVVCPECATPQHRECYLERGECVNAQLHSEGFTWQGEDIPDTAIKEKDTEKAAITCPNCKAENPSGSEVCSNCGMKFVVFGKNLVEILENMEKEDTQTADRHTTDTDDDSGLFRGPYPPEDKTAGVNTNTLGVFMRGNADYYIRKFKRVDNGSSHGFNFAAFFFSPFWFFYRKMIKPGIILLTLQLCISIVLAPYTTELTALLEKLSAETDMAVIESTIEGSLSLIIIVYAAYFFIIVMNIVAGAIANKLYKNHVLSAIKTSKNLKTREERVAFFTKYGGVSWLWVVICYFAMEVLSYLAASFM